MPTLFTQGHFASYLQSVRRMQNLPAPVSPFLDFVQQYTDSVAEQHQATQQQLVRYKFQNLVLKAMLHNVDEMNCSLLETNRELTDQLNELRVKQTNMMSSQVSSSSSSHVESELMTPSYNLCEHECYAMEIFFYWGVDECHPFRNIRSSIRARDSTLLLRLQKG